MTHYPNTTHLASASGRAYSHLPMTIVVGLFSFSLIAVNGFTARFGIMRGRPRRSSYAHKRGIFIGLA